MRFAPAFFAIVTLPTAAAAQDNATFQSLAADEQAVRLRPDSERDRVALATLYLKLGQNRKAAETLQEYLHAHAGSASTRRLLAAAYLREEDYPSAKEAAARAIGPARDDASAIHLLAMAELGLQNTEAAERLFREALKLQPESVDSNFQLGLLYAKKHENLTEAIRLLEKARAGQPELSGVHTALGSAFLGAGQPRPAAHSLEAAVKIAPDSAESWYLLADAYRQLHENSKAEDALKQFNRLNAGSADQRAREMRSRAYYEEGVNLLMQTEQFDRAYQLFNKAVQELPALDAGYYRMAQVSYLKGNVKQALTHIQKALNLNSVEPEYYYVYARCLQLDDRRAALDAVRKAIELRPGVSDFEELLSQLESKK
jgi:tetratricopeptide (TPR) repeat protein